MAKTVYYTPGMRGGAELLSTIRKRYKGITVCFGCMCALFLILAVVGFATDNWALAAVMVIFLIPALIPFLIFLVKMLKPQNTRAFKKNSQLLQQADYLFANMNYQNDAFIAAPGYFALKTDLTRIVPMDEVLLMYKQIVHTNYNTIYSVVVETVRDSFRVTYPKSLDTAVDEGIPVLAPGCKYIRLGYGDENAKYVEYMRTMWQETEKAKRGGAR